MLVEDEVMDILPPVKIGKSLPGKSAIKNRMFQQAYARLIDDYFAGPLSVFDEVDYTRRFCLVRDVFTRVYEELLNKGLFKYKKDCTG
jgi:hypothetical protein